MVQGYGIEVHVDETAAFDVWHLIPVMWVLCDQRIHGAGHKGTDGHVCRCVTASSLASHHPHAMSHCGAILS